MKTMYHFDFNKAHPSWSAYLKKALSLVEPSYLDSLSTSKDWLPGMDFIFNAFSIPIESVNYVLLGESPYPRKESANGYAFWDQAVSELWSNQGFSKKVNRATSLRNFLKMLLVAEGILESNNCKQENIAQINKDILVKTNQEFFDNLLSRGFLLLNASLVLYSDKNPQKDAKAWQPFINAIIDSLYAKRPQITFILLGRIAHKMRPFIEHHPQVKTVYAPHPYNLTFIKNQRVIELFKPLHLLLRS